MKLIDIALKDLLHSIRSLFSVVMMLVVPLLITGLLYLAFGRSPGSPTSVQLPATRVVIANLDSTPGGVGQRLVELLTSPDLSSLIQTTQVPLESDARQAVDEQQAGVAVIIPPDISQSILTPGAHSKITLYQDPTLTVGPEIVSQIITEFLVAGNAAAIAPEVVLQQLTQYGLGANSTLAQDTVAQFIQWVQANPQMAQPLVLTVQAPPASTEGQANNSLAGSIMIGMMIFFIFFTGAEEAQSIIREDEHKTLSRLFTTPTPRSVILGGKILSVFLILTVQTIVLLVLSAVIFGIHWGSLVSITLASLGTIASAGGFGLFVMSFIRTNRQAGPLLGAVLTLTGVAGGTITTGFQNLPPFYNTMTLLTPQGWALSAWKMTLSGGALSQLILPVVVLIGLGLIFFVIGTLNFRKRYA